MTPDLKALRESIDTALHACLPSESALAPALIEALRYAALGGGKRIRPLMVLTTCECLGTPYAAAMPAACAVELIHSYSLVHDDLPAMDDDDLRHGAPSCHIAFDEATAILAGDALQCLAFELLASAPDLEPSARLAMISTLAEAAGWRGMVGGQAFDMAATGANLKAEQLQALHGAKTGALLGAAVQIGAIAAGAEAEVQRRLAIFGTTIGLAFQVIDDVLDVTQTTTVLGKPAGSDTDQNKSTYPKLIGLDASRALAARLLDEALDILREAGITDGSLPTLARFVVERAY
jgi:geranylgeranyl pyrophosphate synthase